ncbi:MAG: riboflavin synthase [Planctomycetota bacterium]|jgi:riboflavin synthase
MFTGLVRCVGEVRELARASGGARLVVSLGDLAGELEVGDSVAISGVCLTATDVQTGRAGFDVVGETLGRTTLGDFKPGARVNVEPALKIGDALGGHFVTGHVDGVATVRSRTPAGDGAEISFAAEDSVLADVVTKGSVAVDGVSLTVAALEEGAFRVALIPHTLSATTLDALAPGARVNVETDMLVKAVRRVLEGSRGRGGGISEDFLREHGFA